MLIAIGERLIPYGVFAMQAGSFLLLLTLLFDKNGKFVNWVGKNGVLLAFLATLAAMVGSLFYSEVIGFTPCVLCWYQRIFIYPQVLIFGAALWKKRDDPWIYSMSLAVIGAAISIYQNLLPWLEAKGVGGCGEGDLCTKLYVNVFGYLTIPLMSLTIFVVLILLAWAHKVYSKNNYAK